MPYLYILKCMYTYTYVVIISTIQHKTLAVVKFSGSIPYTILAEKSLVD